MVLIVSRKRGAARTVSDAFYYMGILSRAATPTEALSEISLMYRAVIILDPQQLPEPRDFVDRLRSYASRVPIFAVSDDLNSVSNREIYDGYFKFSCMSVRLACYIANQCKKKKLPYIGDYRAAGINATCDLPSVTYFDTPITLTKTEAMIVRLLIRTYPLPMKSKSILDYAFKQTRLPDPSSVRTHISSINKKFIALTGRKMITMIQNRGYTLLTPEMIKEHNLKTR